MVVIEYDHSKSESGRNSGSFMTNITTTSCPAFYGPLKPTRTRFTHHPQSWVPPLLKMRYSFTSGLKMGCIAEMTWLVFCDWWRPRLSVVGYASVTGPNQPPLDLGQGAACQGYAGGVSIRLAAATTACPKETPPSLDGVCSGAKTVSPVFCSNSKTRSSSSLFWNTPPESTTLPR